MDIIIGDHAVQQLVDSTTVDALAKEEQKHKANWLKHTYDTYKLHADKIRSGSTRGFIAEFGQRTLLQMNRTMAELLPPELLRMYHLTAAGD